MNLGFGQTTYSFGQIKAVMTSLQRETKPLSQVAQRTSKKGNQDFSRPEKAWWREWAQGSENKK